jgi:hypothetical protein
MGPVTRLGEIINAYKIFVGKPEGRDHAENIGVDGMIISERILRKYGDIMWTRLIWITIWTSGGLF